MRKNVAFYSEGQQIAGHLYLPEGVAENSKCPAVVLCHGFAGFKELLLPPYAEKFAQNGFVALVFDYRGFGESQGERGRLVPVEQIADIRNAITFVQTLPEVDAQRIGLWGTSFGGANAIYVAAVDSRVKALAVQLTFASGERMIKGDLGPEQIQKLESTLQAVQERAVVKNKTLRLGPDQILTDQESKTFYAENVGKFPQLATKIPLSALRHIMEHNPQDVIARLKCPVLFLAAEKDTVCPAEQSRILFGLAPEPKKLVLLENCRHYDSYEGAPFEKGSTAIMEWFSQYLSPTSVACAPNR